MNYFLFVFLPHFDVFISFLGFYCLIASLILGFVVFNSYTAICNDRDIKEFIKLKNLLYKFIAVSCTSFILSIPIPSKKELIQLKAINVLQEIKGIDLVPQKLVDKLNNLLDMDNK